jgi:hypothetical protein
MFPLLWPYSWLRLCRRRVTLLAELKVDWRLPYLTQNIWKEERGNGVRWEIRGAEMPRKSSQRPRRRTRPTVSSAKLFKYGGEIVGVNWRGIDSNRISFLLYKMLKKTTTNNAALCPETVASPFLSFESPRYRNCVRRSHTQAGIGVAF